MKRFIEVDENGHAIQEYFAEEARALPEGSRRLMIDVTDREDARAGMSYNAETDTFSPMSRTPNTKLSHADVLGLLAPAEWAEMNKFNPQASGQSPSGTPYTDAQVFWAVSIFNQAEYIDVADPRFGQIFAMLGAKGILTAPRGQQLQAAMAALAASKGR